MAQGYASVMRGLAEMNKKIQHRPPISDQIRIYDKFDDMMKDLTNDVDANAISCVPALWKFAEEWPANDREQVHSMGFSLPFYETLITGLEVTDDNIFERWTYDHTQQARARLNELKKLGYKVEWSPECAWALRSNVPSPCALKMCFCDVTCWYVFKT